MDHPSREAALLYDSLKKAGYSFRTVTFEDDGFLPEGVESPYRELCGRKREETAVPRYFSRLQVPDGWEIRSTGTEGNIWDYDTKRAQLVYAHPASRRFLQTVNWLDSAGKNIWQDHYDDSGELYARTTCDAEGRPVLKTFYAASGEECIVENLQNHTMLLWEKKEDGTLTSRLFPGKVELVLYYLEKTKADCGRIFFNSLSYPLFAQRRLRMEKETKNPEKNDLAKVPFGGDVLFWQEEIGERLPGNMVTVLNDPQGVNGIAVQSLGVYEKIQEQIREHAAENGIVNAERAAKIIAPVGQIYSFSGTVKKEKTICILTNSDAVEHLAELADALPEFVFHVGALTEMSAKLMAMQKKPNVRLYPGMSEKLGEKLLEENEFYLDINHGNEILDAAWNAYLRRMVIFAFRETAHERAYAAEENILPSACWAQMAEQIRRAAEHSQEKDRLLYRQDVRAMRRNAEDYRRLLGG